MSLLKRRDAEAEAEALQQRVHGVQRTCGWCGAVAACDVTEVVYRRDLDGTELTFGRCRQCARLGDGWPTKVAAALLRLDADALALDGLRVERFVDRAGAHPDRPNTKPWAHVSVAGLTKQAEANRAALELRHGGPCRVCGSTLTPKGTRWRQTRRGVVHCGRCDAWSGGTDYTDEGWRVMASNVLLGRATVYERPHGPPGLAEQLGLTLWSESGLSKGDVEPWSWLDTKAINGRLAERGSDERIDVARWRAIDRARV
jgi:hypothetical protein